MKTYTQALVREIRRSPGLKGLIISNHTDAGYYYAENPAEEVIAMWIEAVQFGKAVCYPCLLSVKGDLMIFSSGASFNSFAGDDNKRLMNSWQVFMTPSEFPAFTYTRLSQDDFSQKLQELKNKTTVEIQEESENEQA